MELVYRGSVKDLYKSGDDLIFKYSNRYSIFDWGEMPDEIPHKGEALSSMAASFFEYLKGKGIDSHYIAEAGPDLLRVQAVTVLRPEWVEGQYDYSAYFDRPTHALVPLEVIFRKQLGQGNSLEGRLKTNLEYLKDLGLNEIPPAGVVFHPALVEFSTKLETSDRYLSQKEISDMRIVTPQEQTQLKQQTQTIADELEKLFQAIGVKLWDGKVEYAFGANLTSERREILLVDSIGPDELRLTYEGLPLSKEFLRQLYGKSPWSEAVKKAKELAQERKTQDWKSICLNELQQKPQPLTAEQIQVSSLLYMALANEIAKAIGRKNPFASDCTLKAWYEMAKKFFEVKT